MRRILIDDHIEGIATDYKSVLQQTNEFTYTDGNGKTKKVTIKPRQRLIDLKSKFDQNQVEEQVQDINDSKKTIEIPLADANRFSDYLNEIINAFSNDLLTIRPDQLMPRNNTMLAKLANPDRIKAKLLVKGQRTAKPFYEIVVYTMQYTEVRKWILPKHIRKVGVKTCVYCNANFTITSDKGHAFYDIDHWKPKAVYPWACLSFFNFQPACHTCNQLKNDDESDDYFGLYESDRNRDLNVLHFSISSGGLTDYILKHDSSNLDIKLTAYHAADKAIADKQNDKLLINQIYKEHNDIVQETAWRKLIANESWINSIKEGLGADNLDMKEVNRLLYANYTSAEDTHKRPLSRLVQDVIDMDFDELRKEKNKMDAMLPINIEVGDYFLLEDKTIIRIVQTHHDFFDCSDNDVHSIDELIPLGWFYLAFDLLAHDVMDRALALSLDVAYGGDTPAHIVQKKIRAEFGCEIEICDEYVNADGYVLKI